MYLICFTSLIIWYFLIANHVSSFRLESPAWLRTLLIVLTYLDLPLWLFSFTLGKRISSRFALSRVLVRFPNRIFVHVFVLTWPRLLWEAWSSLRHARSESVSQQAQPRLRSIVSVNLLCAHGKLVSTQLSVSMKNFQTLAFCSLWRVLLFRARLKIFKCAC